MTGNKIWLFDTTLRDGGQTRGVDFTVADKQFIAFALDEFGIDYIEGGWPGANPTDDAFFSTPQGLKHASLVAFGMTRRVAGQPRMTPVSRLFWMHMQTQPVWLARHGIFTSLPRSILS